MYDDFTFFEPHGIPSEVIHSYLEAIAHTYQARYRDQIRDALAFFNNYLISECLCLREITYDILLDYRGHLCKSLDSHTAKYHYKYALNFVQWDSRVVPAFKSPHPTNIGGEQVCDFAGCFSKDEAYDLLRAAVGEDCTLKERRDYALCCLLLFTSLRLDDLEEAEMGDVVLDGDYPYLRACVSGSTHRTRKVPLNTRTAQALQTYLEMLKEFKMRELYAANEPLFISVSYANMGEGLSTESLYKITKRLTESAVLLGKHNRRTHSLGHIRP